MLFCRSPAIADLSCNCGDVCVKRCTKYGFKDKELKTRDWVSNPFGVNVSEITEGYLIVEDILNLQEYRAKYEKYFTDSRRTSQFWAKVFDDFKHAAPLALDHCFHFATSYLCEQSFSAQNAIRTSERNALEDDTEIRLFFATCNQISMNAHGAILRMSPHPADQ